MILPGDDEAIDERYFTGKKGKILDYVSNNGEAIAVVKYPEYEMDKDNLRIVKISTCKELMCAKEGSLEPTSKNYPLSRMVQMNVLDSVTSSVLQFITFGIMSLMYKGSGRRKMKNMGLTKLPMSEMVQMMNRLELN